MDSEESHPNQKIKQIKQKMKNNPKNQTKATPNSIYVPEPNAIRVPIMPSNDTTKGRVPVKPKQK